MSQLNFARRNTASMVSRPSLRLVGTSALTGRPAAMTIAGIALVGVLAIAILNLLLSIASSTSVYELSKLQQEKRELTTTAQILGEQVDSLSSQQNLANAAESLGMISNANPVFLKLDGQKVFGQPQAALNTSGRAMKNMVPNSQLVKKSTAALMAAEQLGSAAQSKADTAANQAKVEVPQVVSNVSGIPASPTN
jgi:Na+-transporting NADH:ubiquinone oxidoreductase subunit NqrC